MFLIKLKVIKVLISMNALFKIREQGRLMVQKNIITSESRGDV